jgi:hypothetical protein
MDWTRGRLASWRRCRSSSMSSCITAPAIDEQTHHENQEEALPKKPRLS